MITLEELRQRLQIALNETEATGGALADVINEHVRFLMTHRDELDDEGKAAADELWSEFIRAAHEKAQAMPDSPERRTAVRDVAWFKNEHYRVKDVLAQLDGNPREVDEYMNAGEATCVESLQEVADLIHDVSKIAPVAESKLVIAALLAGVIDDCTSALKLARHGLAGQAASLLRISAERLDLVALFLDQPQWVHVWAKASAEERWRQLRPKKVRKLLGRTGDDSAYSFLSEAGSHPTLHEVKGRAFLKEAATGEEKVEIRVGGLSVPWSLAPVYWAAIFKADLALLLAIKWCEKFAVLPENAERRRKCESRRTTFKRDHFLPLLEGLPPEQLERFMRGEV